MSIELIGFVILILGIIGSFAGLSATVSIFMFTTLLGSASALQLGTIGIQPAHFFLGFLTLRVLLERDGGRIALSSLRPPEPGFWALMLLFYGFIIGYFMPRMMAGMTNIIPIGSSEYPDTGSAVPLGPVSGNWTQAIYLSSDVLCFALFYFICSTPKGAKIVANAIIYCSIANIIFAILDVATFSTGTQAILEPIRNATYVLHLEEDVGGMKRIAGSFTEASSFASVTLALVAFNGTLWLCGYRTKLTGLITLVSIVLTVLSTSSTGLAGLPPIMGLLYLAALFRCGSSKDRWRGTLTVILAPLLALLGVFYILLDSYLFSVVYGYVDTLILSKGTTESGITRASWNMFAKQAFFDSYGIGIGLGTTRTSSFPLALLSNVGVPGAIFYTMLMVGTLFNRTPIPVQFEADVRLAARNCCGTIVLVSFISGALVDQGLLFYALAGLLGSLGLHRQPAAAVPLGYTPDMKPV